MSNADSIQLRKATAADGPALAEMFLETRSVSMAYLPSIRTTAETHAWMTDTILKTFDVHVATEGATIVAFLALEGEHLEYLYVRPGYQRRRIGDRLLDRAKELSPKRLEFFVFAENAPAMAFYEARGCRKLKSVIVPEEEEPGWLYEWRPAS